VCKEALRNSAVSYSFARVALQLSISSSVTGNQERFSARNRQYPTDRIQQTASNRQHPTDSIQHTVSNRQQTTDSIQHTVSSRQYPTDSIQQTVSNILYPTESIQHISLVNPMKISLPPLHIKHELSKCLIKAMG
jgi:hypothetical protein